MSRSEATLRVRLVSPAALVERAVTHLPPTQGETAQAYIERVFRVRMPAGFTLTVVDSSSPASPLPDDFEPGWTDALSLMESAAEVADVRVYFDATGRLIIRPTLLSLDVATLSPTRRLAVDLDVIRYTLTFGRDLFSNHVRTDHDWRDKNDHDKQILASARIPSGTAAEGGPAGRLSTYLRYDDPVSQAKADAYAQSVLTAMSQAWVTSRIDAVQDPRIEPDDIVETHYLDRTLRHRVVGVQFDLRTDAMQITGRTALPTGGP